MANYLARVAARGAATTAPATVPYAAPPVMPGAPPAPLSGGAPFGALPRDPGWAPSPTEPVVEAALPPLAAVPVEPLRATPAVARPAKLPPRPDPVPPGASTPVVPVVRPDTGQLSMPGGADAPHVPEQTQKADSSPAVVRAPRSLRPALPVAPALPAPAPPHSETPRSVTGHAEAPPAPLQVEGPVLAGHAGGRMPLQGPAAEAAPDAVGREATRTPVARQPEPPQVAPVQQPATGQPVRSHLEASTPGSLPVSRRSQEVAPIPPPRSASLEASPVHSGAPLPQQVNPVNVAAPAPVEEPAAPAARSALDAVSLQSLQPQPQTRVTIGRLDVSVQSPPLPPPRPPVSPVTSPPPTPVDPLAQRFLDRFRLRL
jgi:hypothetical protein